MKQPIKTGWISCLFLLSIPEGFAFCRQFYAIPDRTSTLFLVKSLIPLLWGIYLVVVNYTWAFRRMFTSGEFHYKRDEETQLRPGAKKVFCTIYSIHILFSLCFGIWLILDGQLYGLLWPIAKILLVLCAYRQLFSTNEG